MNTIVLPHSERVLKILNDGYKIPVVKLEHEIYEKGQPLAIEVPKALSYGTMVMYFYPMIYYWTYNTGDRRLIVLEPEIIYNGPWPRYNDHAITLKLIEHIRNDWETGERNEKAKRDGPGSWEPVVSSAGH